MTDKMKIRTDVFISSTSKDLREYRQAVERAIQRLGFFPNGMEDWAVTGDGSVELCRKQVFDSEIFIGIYAYRYGWQPNGYNGKSITELEYDWAGQVKRNGKPIPRLCFIVADTFPWADVDRENDKLAQLNAFKARVQANHTVAYFTTPDNLQHLVTNALVEYATTHHIHNLVGYLNKLHNESQKSGVLKALRSPKDPTDSKNVEVYIQDVYTHLNVRRMVERTPDGNPILDAPSDRDKITHKDKQELSPLTAIEAINAYPRLVLLGDPGCGKSTFVNFLAYCMTGASLFPERDFMQSLSEQGWIHGEYLPIIITLRQFAEKATEPTVQAIMTYLESLFSESNLDNVITYIGTYLEQGRALVLFDGLDEVPNEKRQLVRDSIQNFMLRYHAKNRYIVTCRTLSYEQSAWKLDDIRHSETFAPLNPDQMSEFVRKWYKALTLLGTITEEHAKTRIEELIEQLPTLYNLAEKPMLLTVIAVVHNHEGTLPKERANLYHRCVELLIQKWRAHDYAKLLGDLGFEDDNIVYEMIWEIAYQAHHTQADKEGAADIPQYEIIDILQADKYFGTEDKHKRPELFCDYIEKNAGLLLGRGKDGIKRIYTFPHRTFQEFLAGCYIATTDFQDYAPKLAMRGANWREVLLLAVGYLIYVEKNRVRDALRGINAILHMVEDADLLTDDHWRAVWLAGEMIQEVRIENVQRHDEGKRAIRRTKNFLVQLIEGGHLSPVERAGAGRVLSQIGDPRKGVGTIIVNGVTLPDIVWCHVPAGEFIMGSDDFGKDDEKPAHKVYLPDFYISRYLITYKQYNAFGKSGDYDNLHWWNGFPNSERVIHHPQAFLYDNHPRERISWYGAMAFCRWLTYQINHHQVPMQVWDNQARKYIERPYQRLKINLPSEAEYEKSARGIGGLIYPYGNDFKTNQNNTAHTQIDMTSSVGIYPDGASPYGILDMSGNVWSWTTTLHEKYPYKFDNRENEHSDGKRVIRGGSWNFNRNYAQAFYRRKSSPYGMDYNIGFFVVCRPY